MKDAQLVDKINALRDQKTKAEDKEKWDLAYQLEEKIERLCDIADAKGLTGY